MSKEIRDSNMLKRIYELLPSSEKIKIFNLRKEKKMYSEVAKIFSKNKRLL